MAAGATADIDVGTTVRGSVPATGRVGRRDGAGCAGPRATAVETEAVGTGAVKPSVAMDEPAC